MLGQIARELRHHAPFTALGAASGMIIMLIIILTDVSSVVSEVTFRSLHPLHVIFSSLTTAAMYRKYSGRIWAAVLVGYLGSIGIATLSDAIIPYLGGMLLGIEIEFHLPFIETERMPFWGIEVWKLVNGAALIGIIIACIRPATRLPHSGHVFLSTWASLFYLAAFSMARWIPLLPLVFLFLFLAVWIPCCISDIVFPLLFIRKKKVVTP